MRVGRFDMAAIGDRPVLAIFGGDPGEIVEQIADGQRDELRFG